MPSDYTFVPWLRRGVAAQIAQVDTLGADPAAGPDEHATLAVGLSLSTTPVPGSPAASPQLNRTVSILGPGDVGGVKADAIIGTFPADGSLDAAAGVLAYVDFYEEDFPWRYTPARATASRLRPWLALFVLTEVEFTVREREGRLPVLTLAERAVPPPHTETWAWAHAQVSRALADESVVGAEIGADPDHALSRLLCPRRLQRETAYTAFLVPAFETGRLAGLGRSGVATTPAQCPAWGLGQHAVDRDFPVYHRWSFTTGKEGDFETLALRLDARPAGDRFGTRGLDVSRPGFGLVPGVPEVRLEGALAPPGFDATRTPFPASPGSDTTRRLAEIVDAGSGRRVVADPGPDPLVVPPVYGAWHYGVPRVLTTATGFDWLDELNLDLRQRAVAGLGAQVVRQRQEELVQRAWEQVGAVEAANQRLREAELSRSVADGLLRKHIATAPGPDRALVLTAPLQAGLVASGSQSVRGAVDVSRVPAAAQAPAFRRLTRPQRPLMRRLTGESDLTGFQGGMLTAMNADPAVALSAAPPAAPAAAGVALASVQAAAGQAVTGLLAKQDRPDRIFLELCNAELSDQLAADPTLNLSTIDPDDFTIALDARVDARFGTAPTGPDADLAAAVKRLTAAVNAVAAEPPDRAVVTLDQTPFEAAFSDKVAGKSYLGVTVKGDSPDPAVTTISPVADPAASQAYATALNALTLPDELDPPDPLTAPATLADHVLTALAPARTVGDRIAAALPLVAARPADDPARLRPVMEHPRFRDPLFEWLRELGQDHVIPNVSDLEPDTVTVLEPNRRHLEAFLAGANHALAQELLWREYPTDQRGTYFQVFWDARDAVGQTSRDDVPALHRWEGALGAQSSLPASVLVLVVRGALLEQYPSTVVSMQRAAFKDGVGSNPRIPAPGGEVKFPILRARLDPDITLVGFAGVTREQARGQRPTDPGWFFVFTERPGEPRFGMDDATPATGRRTWNDLAWDALGTPDTIDIAAHAGLTTTLAQTPEWGRTAADMAAILLQQPVMLARHAAEML